MSNPKVWRRFRSFYISEGASPPPSDGAGCGKEGGGELVTPPLQGGQGALTDQAVQEGAATHAVGHSAGALKLEVPLQGGQRLLGGWGGWANRVRADIKKVEICRNMRIVAIIPKKILLIRQILLKKNKLFCAATLHPL